MNVSTTAATAAEIEADLLILPVAEEVCEAVLRELAEAMGEAFERIGEDFCGKDDEALLVYPEKSKARRAVIVGLGARDELDTDALRRAAAAGAAVSVKYKADSVALAVPAPETQIDINMESATQALVEGFILGSYRFLRYKTEDETRIPAELIVQAEGSAAAGAKRGHIASEATCSARDLVNLSPDDKMAPAFAQSIKQAGERHGFSVEVWDKKRIEEENMGGLLAVNRGSKEPPSFSVLEWKPEGAVNERPLVLVGKGVVFDTGGLSLKPTKGSMDQMKCDMAGAAAVVGAFEAIARMELPAHIVGLVPATDNRPGENAYVPGDVIHMHSGATVEVLNTDAEGRMLLADALSYAATYDPDLVIDLATLTGAAVVALGEDVAAVMTSESDGLSVRLDDMIEAGRRSGDLVHPLPLLDVYKKQLESTTADIKNVGSRAAGSITAGKFLEHFVSYPWIHIDIAGPAFLGEEKPYRPKGGTGFGVRLLVEFLVHYAHRRKKG